MENEKIKGERLLVLGRVDDYSILIEGLKRSKFKPKEIICIDYKMKTFLKSLAAEREIPLNIFFPSKEKEWQIAYKERDEAALKHCNRVLCIGSHFLDLEGKKVYNFEWWKE